MLHRLEVAHFARDAAVVLRCVEVRDRSDAAPPVDEILPKDRNFVSQRGHDAHSSNNDTALMAHSKRAATSTRKRVRGKWYLPRVPWLGAFHLAGHPLGPSLRGFRPVDDATPALRTFRSRRRLARPLATPTGTHHDCRDWGPRLRYSARAEGIAAFDDFVREKLARFTLFGSGDFPPPERALAAADSRTIHFDFIRQSSGLRHRARRVGAAVRGSIARSKCRICNASRSGAAATSS
jgi:hypothetical protein